MKGNKLHRVWLWGMLLLMAACGDDDYYYPPVKLEFVTVKAGEDGRMQTLIPDKGEALPVSEDRTGSTISPNTSRRVMSNYQTLSEGGTATAVIYSLQSLLTPVPKPADDDVYEDGLKHDPVEVVSIWLGRDYLNMILSMKVSGDRQHVFGIVEDLTDFESEGVVDMLLYHNANGDEEYYNQRVYVSVPLEKYADSVNPGGKITVKFRYYTYKDGNVVESDKYAVPGFEYVPGEN